MATVDWAILTANEIDGTTYIKDTDDKLAATTADLVKWVNSTDAYASTGLSQDMVDVTTAQTIAGVKTFSDSPIVPTPTTSLQAVTKAYADTMLPLVGGTVTGQVKGITPVAAEDLARKDYVDTAIATYGVSSGSYTPTITNGSNVTSSTLGGASYTRIGDIVYVSGRVGIDATATATTTVLYVSLPITITSNFTDGNEGYGVIASATASGEIFSTSGSKTVTVIFTSATASNDIFSFNFSYEIN